jgi:hypothetical protein
MNATFPQSWIVLLISGRSSTVRPPREAGAMRDAESSAVRYRRRARTCLEIARTLAPREKRTILIDMAQTWLELAQLELAQEDPATPRGTAGHSQTAVQQQQQHQLQANKDNKK